MLWLLAAALLAQTPETVREADVFAAGVDVEVVNVDVVVSDRQGRPVTGLGPEDFELRVDGESVAVRYFAAPAPAEARPRERPLYLAIYLDRAFLRPGDAGDLVPGAGGGAPGTGTTGFESIQAPAAELDGGELFGRVAQLASANGVRFYALQADSLRASAAAALTRGNPAPARESGGAQWDLGRTQSAASRRAFEELAEATGGRALAGSRDFDAALGAGAGAHRARRDPRRARPSPRIHARGRRRARRPDGGGGRARRLRAAALDPRRAAGVVARRPGTGAVEVR